MNAEDPYFLLWMVVTTAVAWLSSVRLLPWVLVLSCGLYFVVYAPLSLLGLSLVTVVTGVSMITFKADNCWLIGAVLVCFLLFIVYRLVFPSLETGQPIALIGFAFYVLRAIHVLLEAYAKRVKMRSWEELIAWLWFLPTLQVGPIHRFAEFQRDQQRRRWDVKLFDQGLRRILMGYIKIIVLANTVMGLIYMPWVQSLPSDGWWHQYLDALGYGLHLYFQFAGYSEIAIGFALLMGFRVMENFHYPFVARDITDFWRRWHASLSSWCRDYVYVPVFAMTRSPVLSAVGSMLVLGLWHELSWRYLFWGLWHGVGIALFQAWKRSAVSQALNQGAYKQLWAYVAWFITMNFVILSFIFTRAGSLDEIWLRFKILLLL